VIALSEASEPRCNHPEQKRGICVVLFIVGRAPSPAVLRMSHGYHS